MHEKNFLKTMILKKEYFENDDFEKNQQTTTKHEKLPSRQRVLEKQHVSKLSPAALFRRCFKG